MKKEKITIKPKKIKTRKTWAIHPRTRVHDKEGYSRKKVKEELNKLPEEEVAREQGEERSKK